MHWSWGWLLAAVALSAPGFGHHQQATEPQTCDGSTLNCGRRYDQVTYAATHDAFSYAAGGPVRYYVPNQNLPISSQLAAGIRTLGIRPSPYYGDDPSQQDVVYVTHNGSLLRGVLGEEPLLNVLTEVRDFLEANPNEVVTLLSESLVTAQQLAAVFTQAGLDRYLYTHDASRPWPTLQQMIDAGTRLVVFNDSQDPSRPTWQLYMWDYITDTDYNVTDKSQFKCDFYRGQPTNSLYFLNHFIYRDYGFGVVAPDRNYAKIANDRSFILQRATQCWQQTRRIPNYIYVDWFAEGDVVGAVNALNELPR